MSRFQTALLIGVATMVTVGCLPATRVVKNPGDRDRGVRYYRPKPYLLITPMINKSGEPVAGFVGFMPYSACPLESCGSEQQSCYDGQVYGLHFDGKQMTFQLLHDIPAAKETYRPAEIEQIETGKIEPETLPIPSDDSMLEDDDRSSRIKSGVATY